MNMKELELDLQLHKTLLISMVDKSGLNLKLETDLLFILLCLTKIKCYVLFCI